MRGKLLLLLKHMRRFRLVDLVIRNAHPLIRIELVDVGLLATLVLMITTQATVLFFHMIFVLLAVGAFFWTFRSFVIHSGIWVGVATTEVFVAVYTGQTQVEELIEIPLLTIILLTVFWIAQRRSTVQSEIERLNAHLAERATALDAMNRALREESDSRAQLQEEAVRAREQFMHMLVHDLKNPLTAAMGYLEILKVTGLTDMQAETAEGAHRATQRTLGLVGDLLDVARLQENRLHLRPEATSLALLLRACAGELEPWAQQEAKVITIVEETALPSVWVDAILLQRVISNLCSNAIKHTPPGTKIELGATAEPTAVRLWVRDNGQGIPFDRQGALFQPFATTGKRSGGQTSTGLGLAFCKLAVEAHGGAITVNSIPDLETTFTIHLPGERVVHATNVLVA